MASNPVDLSVCIVTYRARELLRDCLCSIYPNTRRVSFEILVVDNNSRDGTIEMIQEAFPVARVIANSHNAGFARSCNQAISASQGRYVILLNNDTLILSDALDMMVGFMDTHPEVGVLGPKVLNRDGTIQNQCRRGLPTPWAIFCYLSGLSRLFPKDKRFARYLLTWLDEDVAQEVDAVSGACLMVRREVIENVGLLDEGYFAYGEDLDYCIRAKAGAWKVYYYPGAEIVHYGGLGGSGVRPFRSIYEFHRSMWIFYQKHLATRYPFFINWLIASAIVLKCALALTTNLFRKEKIVGSKKP